MKIAVLVSGGVDSSVALALLKEQGHDVTAFYLKIWLEDELAYLGNCPWQEDLSYIEAVCKQLNVPFHVVPLQQEYWKYVVGYTIAQVQAGRTPSPDLLCNQYIKFGCFLDHIGDQYERIASGHYAQIERTGDTVQLVAAQDPIKDQTYFLAHLSQQQLKRLCFPIGHLLKSQVRQEAARLQLPTATRKDSYGICFLGNIKFSEFVRHHLGNKPGALIEYETGNIVGQHEGFWYYTIGQRKGIGLSGGPWFVVAKNPADNIVYISRNYYSDDKQRDQFKVSSLHWINNQPCSPAKLDVKIRHSEKRDACTLEISDTNPSIATVKLYEQDQGIAPGQFAVFYDGKYCLGCGVIEESNLNKKD